MAKQMSLEEIEAKLADLMLAKEAAIAAQLEPMKREYEEKKAELEQLAQRIQSVDPSWSATPRRPDLLLADAMADHAGSLPATPEQIQKWVSGDSRCTVAKVIDLLKNGSEGTRPRFSVDANGKYGLKK